MSRGAGTYVTKADSNAKLHRDILPHRLVVDIGQSIKRQDGMSPLNCIRKITRQFPAVFQIPAEKGFLHEIFRFKSRKKRQKKVKI